MGYVNESKRKAYLIAGFLGMLLCGVGDILLSFRGKSNPDIMSGMISMSIKEVPLWYYMLSFFIGIVAAVVYFSAHGRYILSYTTGWAVSRQSF